MIECALPRPDDAGSRAATAARPRWLVPSAVVFLWAAAGSNYLAIRVVTEALPPLLVTAVRLMASTMLLVPLVVWRQRGRALPSARQIGSAAILGLLLLAIGQTLLTLGIARLSAGIAAVLGSSAPLFLALFSWALLREPLARRQVAGICTGFAGLVLMAAGMGSNGDLNVLGAGMVLMFSAAWAAGSLFGSRAELPSDVVVTLFIQMAVASVPVVVVSALSGAFHRNQGAELDVRVWTALAFTIVVGSIMNFGVFTWLNRSVSSTVANSMAYVAPVIALALGALFLGETVNFVTMGAAAVTLVGVALMVGHQREK